jgi:hypothetical protein
MKSFLLIPVILLSACAAPAPREDGSRTITVPAAKVEQCNADGGCAYLSKKQAMELVEYGYAEGVQACKRVGI